jgi:glycerol-3-phosphate dehydrogenase
MSEVFDVAVVGGGVVGCAVARRFTLAGAKTVLLEKAADILAGASKANSALLHTGFDAPSGSLELSCMQEGYAEYLEIRERLNLPLLETGAMVVAWTDEEEASLDQIVALARTNGVMDVHRICRKEALAREPYLSDRLQAAVAVPREHAIDPWSAPLAYLMQALENGAEARFDAEVIGGSFDGTQWRLETTGDRVTTRTVINCAGLFGDRLEEKLLGQSTFTIRPRKGQFVVFDKAAARYLSSIILPVPTERTKGIVLCPTIFGNLLVGPTAEEQDDRDRAAVVDETLRTLVDHAGEMIPALRHMPVTATYAGLRPASEAKEYRVWSDPSRRWITLGGIRSTGLTSSLGLAAHALRLHEAFGDAAPVPVKDPVWPRPPNLAQHLQRDWQAPEHGEIVCHCEMVTRREIEAALTGPVPARDAGGLKRRTRAGMGSCQGFYCQGRVAQLTRGLFATPLATGQCNDS